MVCHILPNPIRSLFCSTFLFRALAIRGRRKIFFFVIVICLFFIFIYSLEQFFIYILHTYFNFLVSIIRIFDNRYSFFFHPRLAAVQLHLQRLLKILYGPNILMMA